MEMPAISRRRAIAYLGVVLLLLALGGKLLLDRRGGERAQAGAESGALLVAESGSAAEAPAPPVLVHVVGAVRRPGLYRLEEGSRVADAVRRAGGARPKAALELVNLAAPVADGQQIVVPVRAQGGAPPAADPSDAGIPSGPVHLNTATLEELDALPGVGPVTAQKILDYRAEHGSFRSVDELDAVPGIGPARLESLRDLVAL
jgi:competence protein ComEA